MADFTSTLSTPTPSRSSALTASSFLPVALFLLRVGFGLLFMQHGAQKLFGWLGGTQVELVSQMGLAGMLEFFGGALVVVGLLTRPVAAVLTFLMVVAYFIGHASQGSFPIQNGGELALLYALGFAFLAASGAGPWSLDGLLRAR